MCYHRQYRGVSTAHKGAPRSLHSSYGRALPALPGGLRVRGEPTPVKGPGWKRTLALPPTVRLIWHESEIHPRDIPIDDLYTRLEFPTPPGPLPYLIANMIMTQNGEATIDGRAATIGTSVDALVLTRLRAAADVLLIGAGTMETDDVGAALPEPEIARRIATGRPGRLLAAVLASHLAWDEAVLSRRFFSDARFDKVVITGDRASPEEVRRIEARGVKVLRVKSGPDGPPDVHAALEALRLWGARLVLSEGGPRVLGSLLRAQVLGEYFLTTSPSVTGETGAPRPIVGPVTSGDRPIVLARVSRCEFAFVDPASGAALVEAYDRFRVVYPS